LEVEAEVVCMGGGDGGGAHFTAWYCFIAGY